MVSSGLLWYLMIPYCPLWSHMELYGYGLLWSFMFLYGTLWSFMVAYCPLWYGPVWSPMAPVCSCIALQSLPWPRKTPFVSFISSTHISTAQILCLFLTNYCQNHILCKISFVSTFIKTQTCKQEYGSAMWLRVP